MLVTEKMKFYFMDVVNIKQKAGDLQMFNK
jgi:hypothetical protein